MRTRFALVLIAALGLAGCSTAASLLSGVAVSFTTANPFQAKTIAEATQAATLAEKALDLYVTSGHASKPVLDELQVLVPAVHNALKKAQAANAAGNSALVAAALAGFNEALAALNSYKTLQGV